MTSKDLQSNLCLDSIKKVYDGNLVWGMLGWWRGQNTLFTPTTVSIAGVKKISVDTLFFSGHPTPLQTLQITFFFSLGLVLCKLQGKVVTHSHDLVWWSFLMGECVTILGVNWT